MITLMMTNVVTMTMMIVMIKGKQVKEGLVFFFFIFSQ